MTYSVYQHWDPLRVCVVGRSYPPEFYSWIKVPHVRSLFERIAQETEEDYQAIIEKLQSFGVTVLRPDLPAFESMHENQQYDPPPMVPRDHMVMIGSKFYSSFYFDFQNFYRGVKDASWPDCESLEEFHTLPRHIQDECRQVHKLEAYISRRSVYDGIYQHLRTQGHEILAPIHNQINGAMVARIGKDLYFGTMSYDHDIDAYSAKINQQFPHTRNHIINTGGHGDATYCPVCPGLIISLCDVPTYAKTFPGWEVLYLPNQSWRLVEPFMRLKQKNQGKWWIPGFENDPAVIDTVETWLGHWTGYVEETVFDVNMLIVDPKNVLVFNYNKTVFDALDRYGITPHVVTFRHRYFWDGGIHCVTTDLDRQGHMQDFFPDRA